MKKAIRRLIALAFVICCAMVVLDMETEPTEAPSDGAALVESMLEKKAGKTAESLVIHQEKEEAELPARYDYREEKREVPVRDQGQHGTCWAFASLTALETALMPEELLDFSRDHLNYHNHFKMGTEEGGSYIMSVAYLTSWAGPVLEQDDPYGDGRSPDDLTAVCHVQEVRMPAAKDYEAIKQTVYLYGGVESSLYMDFDDPTQDSAYYSREYSSYGYTGEEAANHDVVIIGWDDDYPAENFTRAVAGDGAFICQNSWGESFGEDGIFYVSYYDTNIGNDNVAYTRVDGPDNYDTLYQSDLCGWCGQIGYNTEKASFANVYEAAGNQDLKAVGFYATGPDTEYRISIQPEFTGEESLGEAQILQSGYLQYAGYYTIDLNETVAVQAGARFAVIVQITTPDSQYPIAVEYSSDELKEAVDLSDGEGYISADGYHWERVETEQQSNLCLKVYASGRD